MAIDTIKQEQRGQLTITLQRVTEQGKRTAWLVVRGDKTEQYVTKGLAIAAFIGRRG